LSAIDSSLLFYLVAGKVANFSVAAMRSFLFEAHRGQRQIAQRKNTAEQDDSVCLILRGNMRAAHRLYHSEGAGCDLHFTDSATAARASAFGRSGIRPSHGGEYAFIVLPTEERLS